MDWILISSLFCALFWINFFEFEEYWKFGTVWQQRVPFCFDRKTRRDDGLKKGLDRDQRGNAYMAPVYLG